MNQFSIIGENLSKCFKALILELNLNKLSEVNLKKFL